MYSVQKGSRLFYKGKGAVTIGATWPDLAGRTSAGKYVTPPL